jgi:tetratricopeptide (TPR) repeat protein
MKYYVLFFILFTAITACSDNTQNDLSSYEQGVAYAAEGKLNKAQEAFTKALDDDEDKDTARQSLKVVNKTLSMELHSKAATDFFKGIQFNNNGELLLAFNYFSNAIRTAPDFSTAYYERGIVNGRLNKFDRAVEDFSRVIELDPDDVFAYNNRGLARARGLKKYNEAIADFTKAVELDPQFAGAYDNRGIAHQMKSDDKKRACADWKKACDLDRCNSYDLARKNGYCQ